MSTASASAEMGMATTLQGLSSFYATLQNLQKLQGIGHLQVVPPGWR